jgi:glycine/D-amino acid oxidase-like deaminating enzyme
MANEAIRESMDTRVAGQYDVIVAGGGASGLIAAVSAARAGARTAVIERSGCLGGTATYGMVAQWLGFYNRETRVVGGLAYELASRVIAAGGSDGFNRYVLAEASAVPIPLINFPFNPEMVKIVADEFAQEAGVDIYLHAPIVKPLADGARVEGVVIENASGRQALKAKMVVDATGDAAIAAASGVPCEGEQPELRKRRQPCTLVFRLSNVDVPKFRALPREQKRALALEGIRDGRIFWESLSFCSTPGGKDAVSLMSRIFDIDGLSAADLTRAELVGRQQIKSIVKFLRERVPGFEDAVLAGIAARVGMRETRRIVGQHTLTEEQIVGGMRFADAIALGAGPMDLHDPKGTGINLWVPEVPWEIPLGCMLPQKVEGLIATGRAMSATREANGGSRHMGTAMCLGEAAGIYAALNAHGRATLADPQSDEIRRILRSRGALVSVEDALEISRQEVAPTALAA